jgi:hypothetical protein
MMQFHLFLHNKFISTNRTTWNTRQLSMKKKFFVMHPSQDALACMPLYSVAVYHQIHIVMLFRIEINEIFRHKG